MSEERYSSEGISITMDYFEELCELRNDSKQVSACTLFILTDGIMHEIMIRSFEERWISIIDVGQLDYEESI